MLAGSHRNAWPDETGTGGRTNRNTQRALILKTGQKEVVLGEGFALRVFFHGESPLDAMMGIALS